MTRGLVCGNWLKVHELWRWLWMLVVAVGVGGGIVAMWVCGDMWVEVNGL